MKLLMVLILAILEVISLFQVSWYLDVTLNSLMYFPNTLATLFKLQQHLLALLYYEIYISVCVCVLPDNIASWKVFISMVHHHLNF